MAKVNSKPHVKIPKDAEIIHEQEGLTIHRNANNHFVVCTLIFTADPTKREAWWLEEASHGISDAQFRKEYLIDYTALFGTKVFPEFETFSEKIIVKPPYPNLDGAEFYGGLDFGTRSPTSFHVYAVLNDELGDPYILALTEHFEPTRNLDLLAEQIKTNSYFNELQWIAADIHLWDKDQLKGGSISSIADQLYERGIDILMKGDRSEESWIQRVRTYWADLGKDNVNSKFRIADCCNNMIREFSNIVFKEYTDKVARTRAPQEAIISKDNHSLDDCKYFMNMLGPLSPVGIRKYNKEKPKPWKKYLK